MEQIGVIAAVVAVFLFAFTSVISKYILKQLRAPYYYTLLQILVTLPIFLIVMFSTSDISHLIEIRDQYLLELVISSIFAFTGMLTLMLALDKGNASTAGIFLSTRVIFSIPLAIIFLGEMQSWFVYVIIIAILLGSVATSYDHSVSIGRILKGKENGVRWLLLTSLFWSISNFFVTRVTQVIAPFEYLGLRIIIFLALALLFKIPGSRAFDGDRKHRTRSIFPILIVFTALTLVGQYLFVVALSISLTLTEGIGVFEGVLTFILSISLAKIFKMDSLDEVVDRKSMVVRITGIIIATTGVVLLIVL